MKLKGFLFLLCCAVFLATPNITYGQKPLKSVKVATTKRPIILLLNLEKLNRFYLNYESEVELDAMKTAKWETTYYLLAKEKSGNRVFAFELEQRGKRLFLNKHKILQTCDMGELSLDTFLKENNKISGCRLGKHTTFLIPKK
jgi:hypothetical protein